MPLSWDFIDRWFALFGSGDQRQPGQGRNRAPGLCVQPIIVRQFSKVFSKIVTLPDLASCKQVPVGSLRANPGVVLPLRADLDGGGRRRR